MKLELDPTIEPSFQTYTHTFLSDLSGKTEVYACRTSKCVGIEQGTDIVLLDKEDLLKLQELVNQAVKLLEDA